MQFVPGTVRLSDITNGTLAAGTVPLDRLGAGTFPISRIDHTVYQDHNVGAVSIGTSWTPIASIDLGTVNAGDIILVSGVWGDTGAPGTKHITTRINDASGTAVLQWPSGASQYKVDKPNVPATNDFFETLACIIEVTTGGTLVLELAAKVNVGTMSCATLEGGIQALVLTETP